MIQGRKAGLDLIRVVAIGLVLVHHFRHLPGAPDSFRWFGLRADVGVDLFFVLSGWLIGGQLWRERAQTGRIDAWRFWKRRWWRTVPAYLVVLALLVLLGRVPWRALPSMLVFVQNYAVPDGWLTSWSLCVEEQFYLALPIVVAIGASLTRRRPRLAVALAVGCVLLSPVGRGLAFERMRTGTYDLFIRDFYVVTHLRLEGLALGVLAAWMHTNRPAWWPSERRSRGLALGGFCLIALLWVPALGGASSRPEERMLFFHAVTGFALVSLGTALMLPWAARWEAPGWLSRPLVFIADLAYGLYLTHELARDAVLKLFDGRTLPFAGSLGLSVAGSLGAAWLLRVMVERPLLTMRDRARGGVAHPACHRPTEGS
jgi:peptidoglycan/LPS O-acetylase OafA/YrhL